MWPLYNAEWERKNCVSPTAEIMNVWTYTPNSPYVFKVCLTRQRDISLRTVKTHECGSEYYSCWETERVLESETEWGKRGVARKDAN